MASRRFRILKEISAFSLQPILERGVGIFLIPLYTAHLAVTDYGVISYFSAVTTLFIALTSLGQGPAFWKFINDSSCRKSHVYNSMVYSQQIAAVAGIFLIYVLQLLKVIQHGHLLILFLLAASVKRSYGSYTSSLRIRHKALRYVITNVSITLIRVLLTIYLVLYVSNTYQSVLYGRMSAYLIASVIGFVFLFRNHGFAVDRRLMSSMVRYGIPVSLGALAGIVLTTCDKFVIEAMKGSKDLGLYAYAANYATIIKGMMITPFILAWVPNMWEIHKRGTGRTTFPKVARMFTGGILLAYDVLMIAMLLVVQVLTRNADYMQGIYIYPLLSAAFIYYGMYLYEDKGYYFTSSTKYIMYNMSIAAGMNLALNLALVPLLGIAGAALATLLSYITLRYISFRRVYKLYPYERKTRLEMILQVITLGIMTVQVLLLRDLRFGSAAIAAAAGILAKLAIMQATGYLDLRKLIRTRNGE